MRYKFLTGEGRSPDQEIIWHLPVRNADGSWTPGEWMPAVGGEPVECEHGYHGCKLQPGILKWINARLYEIEADGPWTDYDTKSATTSRVRLLRQVEAWNERAARLLACFCAEDVLPIWERSYPGDARPRETIAVARRFANGQATAEELAAAWDAAWDAVRAAARDVAGPAMAAASAAAEAAAGVAAASAASAATAAAEAASRAAALGVADATIRAAGAVATERYYQEFLRLAGLEEGA